MASYKGVKVEIISNGEVLPTYDDPEVAELDEYKSDSTPAFERGLCDAVRVFVNYDGDRKSYYHDLLKEGVGPLLREADFSGVSLLDSVTGHRIRGKPIFAKMDTKETNDFAGAPEMERVQMLGSIVVKVQRVKLLGSYSTSPALTLKRVTELPEKMLKGKAIENTIDIAESVRSRPPPPTELCHCISGPLGKPTVVNVLYRSRRALQSLGCIPRSPSPNPEEEIQTLRARLALLERSANIKPESRGTPNSIKREREEATSQTSRKKARRDGSITVVDLTGD